MLNRSLYIFTSKMAGYAIRIILPYFLVRLLTKHEFGTYRQFFLLEMLIATAFQLGVNQALYYFIPRDEKNAGAYFINSLILNLIIFSAAFAVLGLLATPISLILNMAVLREHFWQLTLYTTTMILIISTDCYLIARRREKQSAFFEVFGQILSSAMTLAGAFYYHSVSAIVTLLVVARGIQILSMLAYTHFKMHGFASSVYFQGIRDQVRYGLILGLGGTFWTVLSRMHDLFVSRYFGTETYAVYSAGCTEIPVVQYYVQSLGAVALGQFARMEKENDWAGMRALWNKILTSIYGLAIPVVVFFLIVSKPLIIFMFTPDYASAIPIFRINTLVKLHLLFNATLVLRAMNRNDVTTILHLVLMVLAVPVLYAGMKFHGITGIIAMQCFLLIGGRVAAQIILNRISGAHFAYFVTPRAVLKFYHTTILKGRDLIRRRLSH